MLVSQKRKYLKAADDTLFAKQLPFREVFHGNM